MDRREEIETWLTSIGPTGKTHYAELLAAARRHHYREPEDVVQTALARMVTSAKLPPQPLWWSWLLSAMRSAAYNTHRSQAHRWALARAWVAANKRGRAGAIGGWKEPAPRAE